jgi:hypothetical protein
MINLIFFEVGGGNEERTSFIAIFLFLLMAAVIVGIGVFAGYKAFKPKNKK